MSTRFRDQQILTFALGNVWATDQATRRIIASVLARHYEGVKLTAEELEQATRNGRGKPETKPTGGQIAVVPLWGVLVPHAGTMVDVSTSGTGLDQWAEQFREAVNDPTVDTVVIQVNSPGGSAGGVTETARIVRDARKQKQIVAVADGLAASAAYAIASQADTLIATPSGMVGAVHTYMLHEDISGMLEQRGIKLSLIGAPNDGAAEAPEFLPLSDENRAHMQSMVDEFYGRFVADVAAGRGVDRSTVEESYGHGRVLTAAGALAAGMVDAVDSFENVLSSLAAGKPAARSRARSETEPAVAVAATGSLSLLESPAITLGIPQSAAAAVTTTSYVPNLDKTPASQQQAADTPARATAGPSITGGAMSTVSIDGSPLTIEELAARQTRIKNELDELDAQAVGRAFTADEQNRFDELEAEYKQIQATVDNINDREARRAALAADQERRVHGVETGQRIQTNAGRRGPVDIFDLAAYRSHARTVEDLGPLWKDGAKRANERAPYRTEQRDETKAFVEALLEQDAGVRPSDSFAHRILVTANPEYDAAFGRWVMGRESNADMGVIRAAVTNTGLGSETPVPVTIDPTVLYTGDGARSPLRALAQVVTITGLTWRGIGSAGVSMAYDTETAAITPVTPTFEAPDVSVVRANGEIQFSVDVEMDWATLRSELQRMFSQAKFRLEADKFLHGTGTNEPTGLIHALDTDGTSIIDTATVNTLVLSDVMKVNDDLPSAFDFNATWLAHKAFYSNIAALAAASGRIDVWVPLSGGFNQQSGLTGYALLGSPAATASEVSKLFTTGGEEVAVIGDFSQGFVIVDRVGLNVELDLHPRDTNGKWTGGRALIAYFRNNTAVRTPNAFRMLRIKHT